MPWASWRSLVPAIRIVLALGYYTPSWCGIALQCLSCVSEFSRLRVIALELYTCSPITPNCLRRCVCWAPHFRGRCSRGVREFLAWRTAAGRDLGQHALGQPHLYLDGAVAGDLPGHLYQPDVAGYQSVRRCLA